MSVPIEAGGVLFGVLMLGPRRNGRRHFGSAAEFLSEVAERVAQVMRIAHVVGKLPGSHGLPAAVFSDPVSSP